MDAKRNTSPYLPQADLALQDSLEALKNPEAPKHLDPNNSALTDLASKNLGVESARAGDRCILLVPEPNQANTVHLRLKDLQGVYGGNIASPLHLTCQRFRSTEAQLSELKLKLEHLASTRAPFELIGKTLQPFHSTFRNQKILKCRIESCAPLISLVRELNCELALLGIKPHFPWVSELVTLFEDIKPNLTKQDYPFSLFWGQRLLITQIIAPGNYETLFATSFGVSGASETN